MNVFEFQKKINEHMRTRTPLDVAAVYEILKDRFPLTLTHAFALENGEKDYDDYVMVCGSSSIGSFQLYDNGLYGVFDVDKADGTYTHWHPTYVAEAVEDIIAFMQGVCRNEYRLDKQTTFESIVCLVKKEPNRNFRMAQQDDAAHVLSLYQSARSQEFSVWNDSYPTITEIEHDLETKNLYVMTDGSKIIGAISVVPENELDGFDCWSCKDGKEIARVVIDKAYQGHGLSFEMVQSIASILRRNGYKAIHLSVVKSNIPAYKTYIKAGFSVVGEAQMYGNDYYLMEKAIDTNSLPKRITDESIVCLTND